MSVGFGTIHHVWKSTGKLWSLFVFSYFYKIKNKKQTNKQTRQEEEKKVFCFIPLYMHFLDNNNIVTDDAGRWWLVFVKAEMWFGSGRDFASMSSSSRSLNLLSVWFCPLILRSWFGVLASDSNCIFAWSFCFFSPTSSKDRW